MIVTLDTNVLFQALHSRFGAGGYIVDLFSQAKIDVAVSNSVYHEYEDVLLRSSSLEKFGLTPLDVQKYLRFFAENGLPTATSYRWRPNLRDEADNMFMELATHSQSRYLITNNVRDFRIKSDLIFDSVQIIRPVEFVMMWRLYYE